MGVCSITSDFAAPTVNYVARNLGLNCNPEITEVVARNKYMMRKAFKKAGLYVPPFFEVDSNNMIDVNQLAFPVIVKPEDRWSSKGVTRVDKKEYLKDAFDYAISESINGKAIIEGFMSGPEYSAECICFKGQRYVIAFTKKETTDYPHYIETGHRQPSDIPYYKQNIIKNKVLKALEALDIQNGAAHVEFRLLENDDVGIIEVGARMGGDCIGTDLTPISSGMDYIRMVIDVACGKEPCFDTVNTPKPVRIKFIIDEQDMNNYLSLREKQPDSIIRCGDLDYEFENEVTDSSTRHGYYIIVD